MQSDNYAEDGAPIRCFNCGCKTFNDLVRETINCTVAEYEVICTQCNETVAYWAYGSFNPSYMDEDAER